MAHDLRQEIYEAVRDRPGLNKSQLATEIDVYVNQVTYHADRLVENGLVDQVTGQGREKLLFHPSDRHLWEDNRTHILFGRSPVRKVGLFVIDHSGTTSKEIATAIDRSAATIRHHLRALRENDLVDALRVGSETHYHCTELLDWWSKQVGDHYERPWAQGE